MEPSLEYGNPRAKVRLDEGQRKIYREEKQERCHMSLRRYTLQKPSIV